MDRERPGGETTGEAVVQLPERSADGVGCLIELARTSCVRLTAPLFASFLLTGPLVAGQGFQVWKEVDLEASGRTVAVVIPLLARMEVSPSRTQLAAVGLTTDVLLPGRITLTGGYLIADLHQRAQSIVQVPLVAVSATVQVQRFTVAYRGRFEKLVGFESSPVRHRSRLVMDMPLGGERRWHVFAADEVFLDLSASRWSQNRAQVGGGPRLGRRLSLDVFYLHRSLIGGGAGTRVIGTTLAVRLRPPPT